MTPAKLATSCQLGVYCKNSSNARVGTARVCTVRTKRFSNTPAHASAAPLRSHPRRICRLAVRQQKGREQSKQHDLSKQDRRAKWLVSVVLPRSKAHRRRSDV